MVGGNFPHFWCHEHWMSIACPLKSDPSRQFLESRNALNQESCSQKLCWGRTVRKGKSEARDLAQQSDIQNPNVFWRGNLVEPFRRKFRADLEMGVRGSLRSSIRSTRHLVAKRCRPLGNLKLQECVKEPHDTTDDLKRHAILYYVAFISVAFISCFLIRCVACDYILFTGNSETNSLPGLTAGNARQLWWLEWDEQIPVSFAVLVWPGSYDCEKDWQNWRWCTESPARQCAIDLKGVLYVVL